MEITGCWKNRVISFWENGAVLFENRCSFEIVSSLQELGQMAGPSLRLAPLTWACPVSVLMGPVTWAQGLSVGAIHWALSGEWTRGPNKIRREHRHLEAPMDRMRSYPLFEFK